VPPAIKTTSMDPIMQTYNIGNPELTVDFPTVSDFDLVPNPDRMAVTYSC
jgi:hypothetical protein